MWNQRLLEWTLVALVLVLLVWVFGHEIRSLQGQSEKVLVRSTFASLRSALVIQQLMKRVRPDGPIPAEKNPFLLLEHLPTNFAGQISMRDAYLAPPGSWMFDPDCNCVGYRLLYPEWLEPHQETDSIWFRVAGIDSDPRLSPLAEYRWFGQNLK